jgi:cellulose synthase operon protein C
VIEMVSSAAVKSNGQAALARNRACVSHSRAITIACGLLALLFLSAPRARAEDDPLVDYRLAVGLYNKEQWKLAADSFQTFLKKSPRHAKAETARYFFALSLVKLDDFKQARDVLRSYAKDFPEGRNVAGARYWIGHCSLSLDDYPAAEEELTAFLEKSKDDPLRAWALPYLGDVELRLRKPEPALGHFQQALKEFPEGALTEDAKFGLARSYELLKKTPEAIEAYQKVADNRAGQRAAEAQLNLGSLYFDLDKFEEAAKAYEVLEQQFPQSPQAPLAQLNHGFSRFQLGQFAQAIAQFEKVERTEKYASEAALWKGLSLKSLPDLPQAVSVLEAAYRKNRERPIAEKLLYQWADCEQRSGAFDKARALYLEVVQRWPTGALADESLHAACQAAVNAGNIPEAESLLTRFDREYPGNKLRLRQEILKGRVLAARNDLPGAAKQLQTVIATTEVESTGAQARYYLADVLLKRREYAELLEVTGPLAALWEKAPGPVELAGVFVLRGMSFLELARAAAAQENSGASAAERQTRCRAAVDAAARYLSLLPAGPLAPQAQSTQTVALALAGDKPAALEALSALRKNHPGSAELDQTLYELGTIAYSREDWEGAETLFRELADRPKESRLHSRALADLAWTDYKRERFDAAATTFARLLAEHPSDALAAEAAFMHGRSLQDAGKAAEAQEVFAEAFRRKEPSDHVFLAGLQSARLLVQLKKLNEADAAYEELLKRFGRRDDADKVLDAWATVHYNAENFPRADELFRRLASEYPSSPLADNARLILAESDLLAGRLDDARRAFQTLTSNPQSDETVQQRSLYQLMQVELDAKRWDELRKVCQDSLTRFPEGTYRRDAQWRWANADFYAGEYAAAKPRLEQLLAGSNDAALKQTAWISQVWVMLAETHFKLKEYAAVAKTVADFRARDEKSTLLYQADEVLGRSLKAQAEFAKAREVFERVIADPHGKETETAARSQFHIAETYHFEKNFEMALKEYLKVDILYKFPEWQAPALYGAAVCQENMGKFRDASKTYDDLLRIFPNNNDVAAKAREGLERVRKKLAAG